MKLTRIILLTGILLCSTRVHVQAQFLGGNGGGYASATSEDIVLAIEESVPASVPEAFQLHQNYPNPFNPETQIRFDIPVTGNAVRTRVSIANIRGQVLRVLLDETRPPGSHEIRWDGKDQRGFPASSGVYLYTIRFDETTITRKMLLMK